MEANQEKQFQVSFKTLCKRRLKVLEVLKYILQFIPFIKRKSTFTRFHL